MPDETRKLYPSEIRNALYSGGFPRRHVDHECGAEDAKLPMLADAIKHIDAGGTTAIIGPRGTGKTQIATWAAWMCLAAKKVPSHGFINEIPCVYGTALEIFIHLRADQHNPESVKKYVRPKVLVIDEIQERGETAFEDRMLTHIIDKRYGSKLATILIGNLAPDKITGSLGLSIVDRIRETGGLIVLDGKSYREVRK